MSAESRPAASGPGSNSHRARQARDASNGAHYGKTYRLKNSTVTIEPGLSGPLARVVRRDGIDYAGPLTASTIAALAEVAQHG